MDLVKKKMLLIDAKKKYIDALNHAIHNSPSQSYPDLMNRKVRNKSKEQPFKLLTLKLATTNSVHMRPEALSIQALM